MFASENVRIDALIDVLVDDTFIIRNPQHCIGMPPAVDEQVNLDFAISYYGENPMC